MLTPVCPSHQPQEHSTREVSHDFSAAWLWSVALVPKTAHQAFFIFVLSLGRQSAVARLTKGVFQRKNLHFSGKPSFICSCRVSFRPRLTALPRYTQVLHDEDTSVEPKSPYHRGSSHRMIDRCVKLGSTVCLPIGKWIQTSKKARTHRHQQVCLVWRFELYPKVFRKGFQRRSKTTGLKKKRLWLRSVELVNTTWVISNLQRTNQQGVRFGHGPEEILCLVICRFSKGVYICMFLTPTNVTQNLFLYFQNCQ